LAIALFLPRVGICGNPKIPYYIAEERPIISNDAPHYLIWHSGNLWHIRWQSPEKKARFSGSLTALDGSISLEKRVNLEKKDKTKIRGSNTLEFKGKVKEQPEGFDFKWTGKRLVVDIYIEKEHMPSKVYIGKRAIRPVGVPFTILGGATSYVNISSSAAMGIPDINTDSPHYMVWHSGGLWHIRWQSVEKKEKFSGTIKAINGSIELDRRVNLEKKDKTKVHAPNIIQFKGKVKEQPEGFDFKWTGSKLMLDLLIDGEPHPERIYVGRRSITPSELPFYIVEGRYVIPFPPRHRTVHRPMPREIPPPFRQIPPRY
jgi:hypothetical protein